MKTRKSERVVKLYIRLMYGGCINTHEAAEEFEVDDRTIHRDIANLRICLADEMIANGCHSDIRYDRLRNGYLIG